MGSIRPAVARQAPGVTGLSLGLGEPTTVFMPIEGSWFVRRVRTHRSSLFARRPGRSTEGLYSFLEET
jgi:hypothetical protein